MGRTFQDAEQFESLFVQMFDDIADHEGMATLVEQRMLIRFRLRDPDVDLWIDGRAAPVTTSFSALDAGPTLVAELSTDSMHELLLGSLPLGRALLFRKLKVQGSRSKAMRLEPLLHAMQSVYPDLVAGRG
jgi:putative sterol carrier protein